MGAFGSFMLASGMLWWRLAGPAEKPLSAETARRFSAIVIPRLSVSDATPDEVVREVNRLLANGGTAQAKLEVWRPKTLPAPFRDHLHRKQSEAKMTVTLNNIPLDLLLQYASGVCECAVAERDGTALLLPEWEGKVEPLVTKVFRLRRAHFSTISPQSWLQTAGVPFGKGCSANTYFGDRYLVVRNTQENVDFCDAMLNGGCWLGYTPEWDEYAFWWLEDKWSRLK